MVEGFTNEKMDSAKRKHTVDLPRSINVSKFAESRGPELEALHAIVSCRTEGNFCVHRSKRRRTTSHENRSLRNRNRKKRKTNTKAEDCGSGDTALADLPRRIRRRSEFKSNPNCGFIASADGTKRLRTHLWYAKRFTMTKLWGFHLPLGLHGKGRGSRAILRRLVNGALISDTSYHSAIQLEGEEGSLISVLNMVMIPCSTNLCSSILSGAVHTNAMLHHAQEPSSPAIAPVTYMWRPLEKTEEQETMNKRKRIIWVWLHAAAFEEGFSSLNSACQKHGVDCVSLEGKLARLELVGHNSSKIMQKVLQPSKFAESEANTNWELRSCSSKESDKCVSSYIVRDPRTLHKIEDSVSDEITLWDFPNVKAPIEEHILCNEKHIMRMKSLFLTDSKEKPAQNSDEIKGSLFCPVLLLNNSSFSRFTIIVPINWVKVFFNSFISNGAHAIGLRETRWISSEMKLPSYPYDFPDCSAWSAFKKMADIESDIEAIKKPPKVRPLRVPMLSPWNAVYDSLPITQNENPMRTRTDSFPGYVARSSSVLSHYFKHLGVDASGTNTCQMRIPPDHKLCFVRVSVRAFKEGAFEEGAIVCAPTLDDVALWTSDTSGEGLQIPKSLLRSCFSQDIYGLWQFHVAEDPELAGSHRSPVGFVTTGFVRGSKKPVGEAVCDAFLLARLRFGQVGVVEPGLKPGEIFVLVRNLRSTAYRLGVAAIVIEQCDLDAEFLW